MEHFATHKLSKTSTSLPSKVSDSIHCGSASWITNGNGTPIQHLQYMPYGEPFVNERISSYNERFTFTGKERDSETGFSYFGARYYDSDLMTGWLSVDPLADKYPGHSPYQYCRWNPIILKDPNGLFDIKTGKIEKGDNLTLIANMINSQYNINLSVSDIAKANDISNYNLIKEGDHIILPGENISLEFNLSNLKVVDNTYNIDMPGLKWNGISGRKGYQSKEFQDMKNIGPIPEGVYILNPEDTQYFSSISLFDKMISSFGGEWRGGKSSWGNVRTWLTPKEGTNTYGRDNFSIHGGSSPGSAGCIDLTSDNDSFHEWFKAYGKSIELNVIY